MSEPVGLSARLVGSDGQVAFSTALVDFLSSDRLIQARLVGSDGQLSWVYATASVLAGSAARRLATFADLGLTPANRLAFRTDAGLTGPGLLFYDEIPPP